MINFNVPPIVGTEIDYIRQAIENHKICGDGAFTKQCSKWIEENTGTAKTLLTTSCTHATEMAAILLDIKPGDEVIMPSYTFVSTADAFVLRGAVPGGDPPLHGKASGAARHHRLGAGDGIPRRDPLPEPDGRPRTPRHLVPGKLVAAARHPHHLHDGMECPAAG